ncbi:dihydroorotate dehydrogenase [Virgibacillus halophilus]|uniref:Dihydroorotate dehydrogenase n=1 Tax=Tigheibacillus halophilus TaxID=361280 RepID=A0ABU5CAE9_9BACI|nr:dihydroorotate dehydrogenase [Virgibacillus halophilus]
MNLEIELPGLKLKNPVMPASGCFGFGREYSEFFDLGELGAVIMKAATAKPRLGNQTPRVAETPCGMLNAIGLQNPGVERIIDEEVPFLAGFDTCILANIAGSTHEEYEAVAEAFNRSAEVDALELNISCPNVKEGGMQFGNNPAMAAEVTRAVKHISDKPVYVKLSPNVTDISKMALAVAEAGADGLSLINTFTGMQFDLVKRKPLLANVTGGLSGAAIKPLAVRMVYDVKKVVDIPIIGVGGITSAEDVLEFLLAGASAVAIGTANFQNPFICRQIIKALPAVLKTYGFTSVTEAIGKGNIQ